MRIEISAGEYFFEKGLAYFKPESEKTSAMGRQRIGSPYTFPTFTLNKNVIDAVSSVTPGFYYLIILDLMVSRHSDGMSSSIGIFAYPVPFEATLDDLQNGVLKLSVNPGHFYRASILNLGQKPVSDTKLVYFTQCLTVETLTDSSGTVMLLGESFWFKFLLGKDRGLLWAPA